MYIFNKDLYNSCPCNLIHIFKTKRSFLFSVLISLLRLEWEFILINNCARYFINWQEKSTDIPSRPITIDFIHSIFEQFMHEKDHLANQIKFARVLMPATLPQDALYICCLRMY